MDPAHSSVYHWKPGATPRTGKSGSRLRTAMGIYPFCVTIQKKVYEYFGHVTMIKTIHYRILECTHILHIFWNF